MAWEILVVDDDSELRESLAESLAAEGYTVHAAEHGAKALQLLARGCRPGIILLDIVMPVMDGRRFLELKAADPELAPIPVVVMSATEGQVCPGAVELLPKPFEPGELARVIVRHQKARSSGRSSRTRARVAAHMERPPDLAQRLKQVEDEYWKIQYPFLLVDEARRAAGKAGDAEMVYGTTPPSAVLQLLELAEVTPDDVFYDLGCGLGLPTIVAALLVKRAVGIEILPEVAKQAQGVAEALQLTNASFQVADFKTADVSDGTVIYCYSTCLRAQSRAELAERVAQTRPGSRVLTVTHNLEHPALQLAQTREIRWEESHRTVYLHVRK